MILEKAIQEAQRDADRVTSLLEEIISAHKERIRQIEISTMVGCDILRVINTITTQLGLFWKNSTIRTGAYEAKGNIWIELADPSDRSQEVLMGEIDRIKSYIEKWVPKDTIIKIKTDFTDLEHAHPIIRLTATYKIMK